MVQSDLPRHAVAASVAALALLCVLWETVLAPLRPGGTLLALKALPLLWGLPGLVRGRIRSYQWWSMGLLAYLCEGVVRGMTDAVSISRLLGWIECGLASVAWLAVLAAVRQSRLVSGDPRGPQA